MTSRVFYPSSRQAVQGASCDIHSWGIGVKDEGHIQQCQEKVIGI